jgi:SAM-dependent methyltransferase
VPEPLALYGRALAGATGSLRLVGGDGSQTVLDVDRWVRDADPVDLRLLAPLRRADARPGLRSGRLVAALAQEGIPALGVDVSPQAVALARRRGAAAICRDAFAPLPGDGRWAWVLLADGNIGIGGDPARLLQRAAALVQPGGSVLVEVSPEDVDRRRAVRLVLGDGTVSHAFRWADVGAQALGRLARSQGWLATEQWDDGPRRFVRLQADASCSSR